MNKKYKNTKGVTLVALVVTIIVLLILAGVSIAALTGDNGLLNKAQSAKEGTQEQTALEKVTIAVLDSYDKKGKLDYTQLEQSIKTMNGFDEMISSVPITDSSFPLILLVDDIEIQVTEDGDVLLADSLAKELKELKENPDNFTHPNQSSTNKDRAIGTDGKAVNLDLWSYNLYENKNGYQVQNEDHIAIGKENVGSGQPKSYLGSIIEGKIEGSMPEYIYMYEKDQVYPVTSLGPNSLNYIKELSSIELPSKLTNIGIMSFYICVALEDIVIPDKVKKIDRFAFGNCKALTEITLPLSLNEIQDNAFIDCTNLKTVYYKGTKEQFDKINIDTGNESLLNADLITNQ